AGPAVPPDDRLYRRGHLRRRLHLRRHPGGLRRRHREVLRGGRRLLRTARGGHAAGGAAYGGRAGARRRAAHGRAGGLGLDPPSRRRQRADHLRHRPLPARGLDMQQVHYDAGSGAFVRQSTPATAGYDTYAFLGGLHMAQFGGAPLRWLYFVLGLAGCVMLASGMQVWVHKREQRVAAAGVLSGHGLVRALNVGVVGGLPLACAAMLVANRLLPADLAARAGAEVTVFWAAWIAAAAWGAVRDRRGRGWRDLFAATAAAMLAIPVANLLTAPQSHLPATIARGEWALAALDLSALGFALAFGLLARQAHRRLGAGLPVRVAAPAPRAAARGGA